MAHLVEPVERRRQHAARHGRRTAKFPDGHRRSLPGLLHCSNMGVVCHAAIVETELFQFLTDAVCVPTKRKPHQGNDFGLVCARLFASLGSEEALAAGGLQELEEAEDANGHEDGVQRERLEHEIGTEGMVDGPRAHAPRTRKSAAAPRRPAAAKPAAS